MLVLGLDPSMSGYGWCVHDPFAEGAARVIDRGRFSSPSSAVFISRYIDLRSCVLGVLNTYPEISVVGVESPPFGESWSEGLYGLFLFTNEAVYQHKKDVVYFDPSTLKYLAKEDPSKKTGFMDKSDMKIVAKADTQIRKWNNDEADAYLIARFAARFFLFLNGVIPEASLMPSERHVFVGRRNKKGDVLEEGLISKENHRFFCFSKIGATHEKEIDASEE